MDYQLDAKHLLCPLPVLRAQKMLKQLTPGDRLIITVNSEDSLDEFQLFCRESAAVKFVETVKTKDGWRVAIERL